MTLTTNDLAGARILLAGPLTDEAHIENFLLAAMLLERAGAFVLHPLSPDHPANSPELFGEGEFDADAFARLDDLCLAAADLLVVLPGWEDCASVIGDVCTAEAAGIGWVEFDRLPLGCHQYVA
jgi:hypothetical protein